MDAESFDWASVNDEPLAGRYLLVGRFICKFEAVGYHLRNEIARLLHTEFYPAGFVTAEMEMAQLLKAYFSLLHLREGLEGIRADLFKDIERRCIALMEARNVVAHNVTFEWASVEGGDDEPASALKWHRSHKKSHAESKEFSPAQLKSLGDEADQLASLVSRLGACADLGGFAIERNFTKGPDGHWLPHSPPDVDAGTTGVG